jgi:hypothetical protein
MKKIQHTISPIPELIIVFSYLIYSHNQNLKVRKCRRIPCNRRRFSGALRARVVASNSFLSPASPESQARSAA